MVLLCVAPTVSSRIPSDCLQIPGEIIWELIKDILRTFEFNKLQIHWINVFKLVYENRVKTFDQGAVLGIGLKIHDGDDN